MLVVAVSLKKKKIAEMQNETQKEIAGIQSTTSHQNTKDQVYAQNEMLAYQQKESTARVASIMECTHLSTRQQVSEFMRQLLTLAQTVFFFQAEDGIRDSSVTGVQTCALPICGGYSGRRSRSRPLGSIPQGGTDASRADGARGAGRRDVRDEAVRGDGADGLRRLRMGL